MKLEAIIDKKKYRFCTLKWNYVYSWFLGSEYVYFDLSL